MLGDAFAEALGDRAGISALRRQLRAHGRVASRRPSSTSAAGPTRSSTCRSAASASATLPLQLVDHALEAFARTAGATLHLRGAGPQRPPPRRGRVQGAGPRPARRVRARPASRGRRLDEGHAGMRTRARRRATTGRSSPSSTTAPATSSRIDQALTHRRRARPARARRRATCRGAELLVVPASVPAAPAMDAPRTRPAS